MPDAMPPEAVAATAGPASLFSLIGHHAGASLRSWCGMAGQHSNLINLRNAGGQTLIIDVGSFDGSDAIRFATATRQTVWTFEPTPSKHQPIRQRLRQANVDSHVRLFPCALSNRTSEGVLQVFRAPRAAGQRFVNGNLGSAQDMLSTQDVPASANTTKVPIHTLDDLVARHAWPNATIEWMKVDAQGFDTLVLRGAAQLLAASRIRRFIFEFTPSMMPGREHEAIDALNWLASTGAKCVPCNSAHTVPRMNGVPRVVTRPPTSFEEFVAPYVTPGARNTLGISGYDDMVCVMPSASSHEA